MPTFAEYLRDYKSRQRKRKQDDILFRILSLVSALGAAWVVHAGYMCLKYQQ